MGGGINADIVKHVESPEAFFRELQRVGKEVTLITPPLWDLIAVLNFTVHRWIVISFRKEHTQMPLLIPYPLGILYFRLFGQAIRT